MSKNEVTMAINRRASHSRRHVDMSSTRQFEPYSNKSPEPDCVIDKRKGGNGWEKNDLFGYLGKPNLSADNM